MVMLRELAIGPDGDLRIENGNLVILEGAAALAQRIAVRLRTLQGEWVFDRTLGTPWLQSILVPNPRLDLIRSILNKRIRDTEGVARVLTLSLSVDRAAGVLFVSGRVEAETGEEAEIELSLGGGV